MAVFAYGTLAVSSVKAGELNISKIYYGETTLFENFGSKQPPKKQDKSTDDKS